MLSGYLGQAQWERGVSEWRIINAKWPDQAAEDITGAICQMICQIHVPAHWAGYAESRSQQPLDNLAYSKNVCMEIKKVTNDSIYPNNITFV